MPNTKLGLVLFSLLIFPVGLLLHLVSVDAVTILYLIGNVFGRVVAICGINGITVSEKPTYLIAVYFFYISLVIGLGFWFTIFLKNLIEHIFTRFPDQR